jgi:hypothetical protein
MQSTESGEDTSRVANGDFKQSSSESEFQESYLLLHDPAA